jgi:hypothetical protein
MSGTDITRYVSDVAAALRAAAPGPDVDALVTAGANLAAVTDQGAATAAELQAAADAWVVARDRVAGHLDRYLVDDLPELPGLSDLARAVGWDQAEGLHGEVDIGPLHLAFASSSLILNRPPLPAFVVGPFQPSSIAAAIRPPGGGAGDLPGGGSVVRLPGGAGFGGTLQVPLGVVAVDAAALLERLPDGTPSFLAILGISFTPPIQLSFGFSLDRVGGIVGVNRAVDTDALALALRSGAAGDALFAVRPPASPAALVADLQRFFPRHAGRHVVGPSLRLSWLSFGSAGSFVSIDVGVVVELPTAKVVLVGVARAGIPGLPGLIQLRLDVLGVIDPIGQLVSIDASLVDSHVLGVFEVYGDAAFRFSWGSQSYVVLAIGGFYPGFDPEPARVPALRRVGMAVDLPIPGLEIRAEGYFAITTNTVQLGARFEMSVGLGLTAHGFLQVDALVQFRPFRFEAACSAGFDVEVFGLSFAGVRLAGTISGPGPITIRGELTIETFLFDVSWDESFTIGSGPSDTTPRRRLLDVLDEELRKPGNLRAEQEQDPAVVLEPRAVRPGIAAVPPAGTLRWSQRRAPLGFPIDRVDGQPLGEAQGVVVVTPGPDVSDRFSPGSYCNLTEAEALHRPPFDTLRAGVVVVPGVGGTVPPQRNDERRVEVIVVLGEELSHRVGVSTALMEMAELVFGSQRPPALSDPSPLVVAERELWATVAPGQGTGTGVASATEAHQVARQRGGGVAVPDLDARTPVSLAGI